MRGERIMNIKLYALIRYLQKPGGISIEDLCNELQVSRATVFRYLEILQEMNLPVTNEIRNRKSYYFFDSDPLIGRIVYENIPYLGEDFFFDDDEKKLIEQIFSLSKEVEPSLEDEIDELHDKIGVLLSFAGHVTEAIADEDDRD